MIFVNLIKSGEKSLLGAQFVSILRFIFYVVGNDFWLIDRQLWNSFWRFFQLRWQSKALTKLGQKNVDTKFPVTFYMTFFLLFKWLAHLILDSSVWIYH